MEFLAEQRLRAKKVSDYEACVALRADLPNVNVHVEQGLGDLGFRVT